MKPLLRRLAVTGLVLLLGCSLWLNVWLALKVLDYKGRLFLSYEFREDTPLKVEPDGRQLVWLAGDSRIAEWRLPDTANRRYINRGVSGFTVRQTLDRFRADLAAGSRPQALVVQAGINDVTSAGYNRPSRLPAGALKNEPGRPGPDKIILQCLTDLKLIAEEGRKAGCHVILLTVFPPGPYGLRDYFFWDATLEKYVSDINTALLAMAGPSVTILDTTPLLAADGRTRAANSADALHLNTAGYQILSQALQTVLDRAAPSHPDLPPGDRPSAHVILYSSHRDR